MSSKKEISKKNKGNEKDRDVTIFFRYFIVASLISLFAIYVLVKEFKTGVTDRKKWLEIANTNKKLIRPDEIIYPVRGNIMSDDKRLMAACFPYYKIYLDFGSEGFLPKKVKDKMKEGFAKDSLLNSKYNNIDSLSFYLSRFLQDRTPAGYKTYLMSGLKAKKRYFAISNKQLSFLDLKEIRKFPFLRIPGNRSFFNVSDEIIHRIRPFGMLAARTIGEVETKMDSENGVTHGRVGLELEYDSLLRGVAGVYSVKRLGWHWTKIVEKEPVNGMDVRSTININIQDIVEKALTDKLKALNAASGIAVVMEVETGKIKAITNMERRSPGNYAESYNHAVSDLPEPGSTFKVAAMMVAIEDGVVQPNTPVDVGDGDFYYAKANRHITDHNKNKGGYHFITAEKAIWYSSNIGLAKIVLQGYEKKPQKFVEGLHRIGMDADLKLGIKGAAKPKLRWPKDKQWSVTSLPYMSFGYEVTIPPIQTLTFYNAIANNGKMVKPLFVTDILRNEKVIQHFDSEVIIPEICSDRTLQIIKNMLYNVVNYVDPDRSNPHDGTGKPAKSSVITIAGKTGTAQINNRSGVTIGHNVSFCGFFPYEKPQYTCIVCISGPNNGEVSGGTMCGSVVKDIAEKIYSGSVILDINKEDDDSAKVAIPDVKKGGATALKHIVNKLDVDKKGLDMQESATTDNLVPNVVGMGAKDAVFLLENCGLKVSLSGYGKVDSQSMTSGSKIVKGQTVILTLK